MDYSLGQNKNGLPIMQIAVGCPLILQYFNYWANINVFVEFVNTMQWMYDVLQGMTLLISHVFVDLKNSFSLAKL